MEIIVIGGSAAGLKAACRVARLDPEAQVTVLERSDHFGYSACSMPYFVSGDISDYEQLISTSHGAVKDAGWYKAVKRVKILANHEAVSIDRDNCTVTVRVVTSSDTLNLSYDKLVIATGTIPKNPTIFQNGDERIMHFSSPTDAIRLHQSLSHGEIEKVAIIGGGFIGLEMCEAFVSLWGIDVTLIELEKHVLQPAYDPEMAMLVEDELIRNDVNLLLESACEAVEATDEHVIISLKNGEVIAVDRVIVAAGVEPNTGLAKDAGLSIGKSGGIVVDSQLRTPDPDIYAAGDCAELKHIVDGKKSYWALGSLANRTGRVVADNICGINSHFGPVTASNVFKVFDLTVGEVGLSEQEYSAKGGYPSSVWGTFYDRVHSYPESEKYHMKLVSEKKNGKIVGLQAVGSSHLLHAIDKASILIKSAAFIEELKDIEHAYSPPYSQPFDPLHYLAFIKENCSLLGIGLKSPLGFYKLNKDDWIIDVRTSSEIQERQLPAGVYNTLHIPLEELRARMGELPGRSANVITICEMGARSWDAAVILKQAGWKEVSFFAGGIKFLAKHNSSMRLAMEGLTA